MVIDYPRGPVPAHSFTADTAPDEAIEIQLVWCSTASPRVAGTVAYQLTAWRTERNTVGYSLLAPGGTSCALQNLQSKTFFPGKAKQGWQLQVIDWASAGLHEIKSIA